MWGAPCYGSIWWREFLLTTMADRDELSLDTERFYSKPPLHNAGCFESPKTTSSLDVGLVLRDGVVAISFDERDEKRNKTDG